MAAKAGKKRVLVPHKLNTGKWQVSLGTETKDGKRKWNRKQFSTKSDAQDFCNNERARVKEHGAMTAGVDGGMVAAWVALDAQLRDAGAGTLTEAGARVLKNANAIKVTGTAKECLNACHSALIKERGVGVYSDEILKRCNRFLRWFGHERLVSEITQEVMINYFSFIKGAKTDRRTVSAWLGWAVDERWLASNPCARPPRRKGTKQKPKAEAVVMSPQQAGKLLQLAVDAEEWVVLGYLVISLFGGVRPEEFRKRVKNMEPLDWTWEEIKQDTMTMPPRMAKTGVGRVIEVNDTLAAWLQFLRDKRGTLSGPILAAGKRGGWRPKWDAFRATHYIDEKGDQIPWHPDQLRHSYGSYSLAQSKDVGKVAMAMGNSPSTLLKHYWNWKTLGTEAISYFNLFPENMKNIS